MDVKSSWSKPASLSGSSENSAIPTACRNASVSRETPNFPANLISLASVGPTGLRSAHMLPPVQHIIAALCLLLLLPPVALPQSNAFNVRYLGGSLQTKTDKDDWHNNLIILSDEIRVELKDGQKLSVDPKSVTSISYGREATRHVARWVALGILISPIAALGLFNENVKHYVSIEY